MISVVIADDELIIRNGIKKIISDNLSEFSVVADFDNGSDCLEFLSKNIPDLIICDIRMPVLNGIELIKKARERNITTDFLFVSGYDDFEYCKAAIQEKAYDYLLKPVDKTDFIRTLTRYAQAKNDTSSTESEKKLIRDIRQYLKDHFNEKLTVDMLASVFCLSPNYLSHLFKTETGTSLSQYINEIKMDMACLYLQDSTKRVNEIASLLGYGTSQQFANTFKKIKGITPSEYRETML